MNRKILITNCRLFDAAQDASTTCVRIEDGIIAEMGQIENPAADNILDAESRILAPGLIDIHIQGAGGADVLDSTPEALQAISQTCTRFGATGFLATTVFRPGRPNEHLSIAAENVGRDLGGANLLGIHLEGPFISSEKRGMIRQNNICPPSMQVLDEILHAAKGKLRIMTIAPELPEGPAMIRRLVDSDIVASFGHSNATYEQTLEGFDAGISHVTHLFNAMPAIHHRSPGPLVAIFETERITAQIIPDGVHIQPPVLRFAFKTLGPARTIAITDGMQAIGLPEGKYTYNGVEYESKNGTAGYADGMLIGTALGMSQLLARLMTFTDCPLETAIKTAAENPAKLLGIENRKGSIKPGKDADLILLDPDHSVHTTIVAGKIVYRK